MSDDALCQSQQKHAGCLLRQKQLLNTIGIANFGLERLCPLTRMPDPHSVSKSQEQRHNFSLWLVFQFFPTVFMHDLDFLLCSSSAVKWHVPCFALLCNKPCLFLPENLKSVVLGYFFFLLFKNLVSPFPFLLFCRIICTRYYPKGIIIF